MKAFVGNYAFLNHVQMLNEQRDLTYLDEQAEPRFAKVALDQPKLMDQLKACVLGNFLDRHMQDDDGPLPQVEGKLTYLDWDDKEIVSGFHWEDLPLKQHYNDSTSWVSLLIVDEMKESDNKEGIVARITIWGTEIAE